MLRRLKNHYFYVLPWNFCVFNIRSMWFFILCLATNRLGNIVIFFKSQISPTLLIDTTSFLRKYLFFKLMINSVSSYITKNYFRLLKPIFHNMYGRSPPVKTLVRFQFFLLVRYSPKLLVLLPRNLQTVWVTDKFTLKLFNCF